MNRDKTESPFFSVIIPVYNNEKTIEKCVDSILLQSYENFELILVNDGSTDSTPEICDRYAGADNRIHVIHMGENKGGAAARNEGLFRSVGRYICYVDGDDWIDRELLQEAACILQGPDSPDIFSFGYTLIEENGKLTSYPCFVRPGLYRKRRLEREIYPRMMRARGQMTWVGVVSSSLCDKIISRELLMKHYCQDTSLFAYEDFVCAYECMYFADKVYFSSENFYYYNRFSGCSMHQRYHKELFENSRQAARYRRLRIGRRGNDAIEEQINQFQFDGLVSAIYQELQFRPSFVSACGSIREKTGQVEEFPICPVDGLTFSEKCYVYLVSFGHIYPALLATKAVILLLRIWRK